MVRSSACCSSAEWSVWYLVCQSTATAPAALQEVGSGTKYGTAATAAAACATAQALHLKDFQELQWLLYGKLYVGDLVCLRSSSSSKGHMSMVTNTCRAGVPCTSSSMLCTSSSMLCTSSSMLCDARLHV
jgi:hypothetical protein